MANSVTKNEDVTVRFVHDFDSKTLQGCLERFKDQKFFAFAGFPRARTYATISPEEFNYRRESHTINGDGFITTGPAFVHDESKFPHAVPIE